MVKLCSYLMAATLILRTLGGPVAEYGTIWSLLFIFLSFLTITVCLVSSPKIKRETNSIYLFFVLYLLITISLNDVAKVFNSYQKLALLSILLAMVSPMFNGKRIREFRKLLFNSLCVLFIVVSVISFFCYFLNINWMKGYGDFLEDYEEIGGHFSGIIKHSMLLGPFAGIASICCLSNIMERNNKYIALLLVLFVLCFGALLFSASRAAILATVGGMIMLYYMKGKSLSIMFKRIVISSMLLLLLYPLWSPALSGVLYKQYERYDANENGLYGSRTAKIERRLIDFEKSPIIGVGFAACSNTKDLHGGGNLEPGSSWFFVLSSTGLIGFILFVYMFRTATKFDKNNINSMSLRYLPILCFFIIHLLFEGYVYFAGSPLCLVFWLTLGVAADGRAKDIQQLLLPKRS